MLSFFITLLFSIGALSLSCSQQWECSSVTTDYNFVACNQGTCACRTDLGFVGAATTTSKCACPSGSSVNWENGVSYCYRSAADAVSWTHEQQRNQILTDTVRSIYNALLWPAPATIIQQLITGNFSGGVWANFDAHSNGRVDPVGSFHDEDGVVEYFFGSVWTGTSQVQNVNITKLHVQGNVVFVRVILTFVNYDKYPGGNQIDSYLLTQSGTFTFNDENKVLSTELIIHNLGWALEQKFANQTLIRQKVCQYYFYAGCSATTDPDGFYGSMDACMSYMNALPYGTWDQVRSDSVVCRYYHVALAIARPAMHCPHAGISGGGKCVPKTYLSYYDEAY